MSEEPSTPSTQPSGDPAGAAAGATVRRERFEATVHPGEVERPDDRLAALDVDRVPDPADAVRILADLDECAALVREGFEVRLLRAVAVEPALPDAGRLRDDDVRDWVERRLHGIPRESTAEDGEA